MQIRYLSHELLTKRRRKKYAQIHGNLEDCWDNYETDDEYTTSKLLREVSYITGLAPVTNGAFHILPEED